MQTLRAYCVDTILKRVATYDVSEQQRQKGDAALMEGSGDGQLHRVTLLKALGRCELSRAFRGLPLTYAATRRFLVAAGPAKGAKVFDALRESADASSDLLAVESAEWLVDELMEAGKLKRDRGPELVGAAKNAAKRAAHAERGDRSPRGRRHGRLRRRRSPRDIRLTRAAAAADERSRPGRLRREVRPARASGPARSARRPRGARTWMRTVR